jgi:DNA-binding XRE family transcriptional regulator
MIHEAYDAIDLGRAIRGLREQRGWTQAELASWLDVNRSTVITLEKGGSVSMRVAMKAIALLGAKAVIVPKAPSPGGPSDTDG